MVLIMAMNLLTVNGRDEGFVNGLAYLMRDLVCSAITHQQQKRPANLFAGRLLQPI
jgi:hypothetical protein